MKTRLLVLLLILAARGAPSVPISQSPADPDLERIRREIGKLRSTLANVRRQTTTAEQELETVELQLAIETREYKLAVQVQDELEQQRQAIVTHIESLSTLIVKQKAYLASRLAALYRLGQLSYLRILLSIDRHQNPFEGMAMLGYLISRDARAVSRFQTTRERLAIQQIELADRQQRIERARLVVEDRRKAIQRSRTQKAAVLARLRSQRAESEKRLEELEEKARRLERLFAFLYEQNAQPEVMTGNIVDFKGALAWPVEGKVTEAFGKQRSEKFATYTVSNGLTIEAAAGSEVRSVFEGTVLYSDWFKGYGHLVIVDHGNRIFSLYGNTREVSVAVGQQVTPGQVIAQVAEGEEGDPGHLYFEIREDNKPADPQHWLR